MLCHGATCASITRRFTRQFIELPFLRYTSVGCLQMTIFGEIALALVVATFAGFAARFLRQPTIVGFIAAGLFFGLLGSLKGVSGGVFESLASLGVTLLLFIVGLEMDFRELAHIGFPALMTGVGQIVVTFGLGYYLLLFLGFAQLSALYVAIALTFSSTIIVVKLLSEKRDLNSLHGRIVVGFLLVQDLVAILLIIFLGGLARGESLPLGIVATIFKGAALVFLTLLVSRGLPRLLDRIGTSGELLFLFSLAWSFGIAALVSAPVVGLSIEIGGFLAGLALANSSEHFQIAARLRPLRDFFLILFFVGLGSQMVSGLSLSVLANALLLSLFVLVVNPLIVLLIMGALGYRARTSFLASLAVAQISEFSFILMALGGRLGHVESRDVSVVTLVGAFTIFVSSYLIMYGREVFSRFKNLLAVFEFRKHLRHGERAASRLANHVIVIGAHRVGASVVRALLEAKKKFVVVDYDPRVVRSLARQGVEVFYGDASDEEILSLAGAERAEIVVSTVPSHADNAAVISMMKRLNPRASVVATGESEHARHELYRLGAHYVVLPHLLGGMHLAHVLVRPRASSEFSRLRERDLKFVGDSTS
ncbi:MAG: cation:proton antiporter [Candidatus Colwellbacteria bacterium]|nr:cation:proton antiporter [Candidatus Colwellbacteria bacterium]